jgi:5-carboxymethyl-2-hydroxymuconate isomerase
MAERLGDAPIEPRYVAQMKALAKTIDQFLNGDGEKKTGFIVMMFPLNTHDGRANYISNAKREDVVIMLKEQIKRFEGQPDMKGHA